MKTPRLLTALLALLPAMVTAQVQNVQQEIVTKRVRSDITIGSGKTLLIENGATLTTASGATVSISGLAPSDATFITQTSNSGLSAEQPLSALVTGLVRVTTTTGVLASVTDSAGVAGLLSDETGTGALVFADSPALSGTITGTYTFGGTPTFPSSVATLTGTQTFTNKTHTAPLIDQALFTAAAAPGTPAAGKVSLYAKGDGLLYSKDDAGVETALGGGGGGGGGGLYQGRTAKTSAYTIVAGDQGDLIDCTTGTFSVALDAAATLGDGFFVGIINTGSGSITVDPDGSETISNPLGNSNSIVLTRGQGLTLLCTGTGWIATTTSGVVGPSTATSSGIAIFSNSSGGRITSSTTTLSGDTITFVGGGTLVAGDGVSDMSFQPGAGMAVVSTETIKFKVGASSGYARTPGVVHSNITATGNVGAGEDTLTNYNTSFGMLNTNGERFRIRATFTFAANGNNKTLKAKFGGTTYFDSTALAINGGSVVIEALVTRTGTSTQNVSATIFSSNTTLPSTAVVTTAAETSGSGTTIRFTGEATADNDIIQKELLVEYLPAP